VPDLIQYMFPAEYPDRAFLQVIVNAQIIDAGHVI
jgi:hypothetical protein